jgi:protein-L-isoaspartate(D-aspartate) O-methyltransferase
MIEAARFPARVTTYDINSEVTARAAAAIGATGYADRVTVLTGDGEHGAPGRGPFDAIIATAGAWDIPPSGCPTRPRENYPPGE